MRFWSAIWMVALALGSFGAQAAPKKSGATFSLWYAGGTLPLSQGKMKTTIAEDELVFVHGHQKVSIPLQSILAITSGTDVRYRFGAPLLGIVPLVHLDRAESYYVGLTWTGDHASKVDAVFKLSGSEYRDLLSLLERLTGRKATDTSRTATVVRYET